MALTKIKTGGLTDNSVTDAKVANAITVTGAQTGITSVGTLTNFTSTGIDDNAGQTALSITSEGRVQHTSAIANSCFDIANTHADGYGAHIQAGSGTKYSLVVKDKDNNERLTVLGNGNTTFAGATTFNADIQINDAHPMISFTDTDDNSDSRIYHSAGGLYIDADNNNEVGSSKIRFSVDDSEVLNITTSTATFADNIVMSENKRISIGTWDNSGFTGGNAYGLSIDSELPIIHMSDTDTNKKAFFGLSGNDMYIGGNPVDNMVFQTGSGVERMRITSAGLVGIGLTDPGHLLDVTASDGTSDNNPVARFVNAETTNGRSKGIYIRAGSTNDDFGLQIDDHDASATLLRFTGAGRMGLNTIAANAKLDIREGTNGQEIIYLDHTHATNQTFILFKAESTTRGTISFNSSSTQTTYNATSDKRVKENIKEVDNALSMVNKIPVKKFNFKVDKNKNTVIGYIGQELIKEYPQAVTLMEAEGYDDFHMVDNSKLVPILMKAVQELSAKVEALENA